MAFHLTRNESLEDGLKRIAREQLGIIIDDFENDEVSDNDKIHGLRSRCKKMRALLRLPGPVMGAAFHDEDRRFQVAGRRLREIRDAYVQAQTLASFKEDFGLEIGNVASDLEVDPAIVNESLREIRRALEAVDGWKLKTASFSDLLPGIGRTYAKGWNAWHLAVQDPTDEHFHRLRKWAKYLWYQTRVLERLNRRILHPQRVRLQVLGEVLGRAHDLAVLEAALELRGNPEPAILERARNQKQVQYVQALKVSRQTFRASPDQLVADMARWWIKWRKTGAV